MPIRPQTIKAPLLTRECIAQQAESLIRSYFEVVGHDRASLGINFDRVYEEFIYPRYEIVLVEDENLGFDQDGAKIFGSFDAESNTAYIDASLRANRDPRRIFTCWHEVGGHGILQGDWIRSELRRVKRRGLLITTEAMLSPDVEWQLERQANLFASHAAAPGWLISYSLHKTFGFTRPYRYTGPGKYCFPMQSGTQFHQCECFADLCIYFAIYLQRRFGGLSVESLSYRVEKCPMVIDCTDGAGRFRLHRRTVQGVDKSTQQSGRRLMRVN